MAGHMGDVRVTTQNLTKWSAPTPSARPDLIKGAVPGADGGWVLVRDAARSVQGPKDRALSRLSVKAAASGRGGSDGHAAQSHVTLDAGDAGDIDLAEGRVRRCAVRRTSCARWCVWQLAQAPRRHPQVLKPLGEISRRPTKKIYKPRRARAARVTAPSARRSSAAAARRSVRSFAAMRSTCPRRCASWALKTALSERSRPMAS